MAIVDVYDALTSIRPYKKAFTHEEALKIISAEREAHFDPLLVEAFLAMEHEIHTELQKASTSKPKRYIETYNSNISELAFL